MDHDVFRYQRELAGTFQVILYDIRGHGGSGIDGKPVTITGLAEELLALVDRLELDQVVVVGYSSGGSIAQEFALNYPERTKALILSGGFPRVNTFLLKNEFRSGIALVKAGKQRFLSRVLAWSHKITEEDERDLFSHCLRSDAETAYNFYRQSLIYDCFGRLSSLSSPMLLLNGTHSEYMHPYIDQYVGKVKRFTSILVDKGKHQLPTRWHEPFNQAITHFVRSL
jgi:pimeloyl-ACP methyl ester carboxylesterase